MAEPTEGAYIILCVGSQKALDVKWASDESHANVQQWGRNDSDAQIWSIFNPEDEDSDTWCIACALTTQSLQAGPDNKGTVVNGANVMQSTANTARKNQRWDIVDTGGTTTYQGETYTTYWFRPDGISNVQMGVEGNSSAAGANIKMVNASTSNNYQKWILFPKDVFQDDGVYEIAPACDISLRMAVANASYTAGANLCLTAEKDADDNAQAFFIDVDDDTNTTHIVSATTRHFERPLTMDIQNGKIVDGRNVWVWGRNDTAAQRWAIVASGDVKALPKIVESNKLPTYQIRAQAGNNLRLDAYKASNIRIAAAIGDDKSDKIRQRFVFIPSELYNSDLTTPSEIGDTLFTLPYSGSPVSFELLPNEDSVASNNREPVKLYFGTSDSSFQARIKTLKVYSNANNNESFDSIAWRNLVKNDVIERYGWADAWAPTFVRNPSNGLVLIPFNNEVITIGSTHQTKGLVIGMDLYVEIRVFGKNEYDYPEHGTTKRSIVKFRLVPTISLSSINVVVGSKGSKIGLKTKMSENLGRGLSIIRVRMLDENRVPISDWATSTSLTVSHYIGETLHRMPNSGEQFYVEYSASTEDGVMTSGTLNGSVSYSGSVSANPTIVYDDPEACCCSVSSNTHLYDYCIMSTMELGESTYRSCELLHNVNNVKTWRVVPPLNTDVQIIIIASDNGTDWGIGVATCRIDSHLFIWNWTADGSSTPYDDCAGIIVNHDAPPQQTRSYATDIKFSSPAGRVNPVAFAGVNLNTDLSVEGTVMDEDANYQAALPLPPKTTVYDLNRLIRLAGKGIHPIYRTPYGDWYYVGIESIDISKKDVGFSTANIKQRAVED